MAAPDHAELANLLVEMTRIAHRRSAGDTLALMNEAGLTMGQMVALFILVNAGEQAMGVLAQKVQLSPAAATHMIEQLVQGGLVARFDAPQDRRSKRVRITDQGRALIQRLDVERRREFAGWVAQLRPHTARRLAQAVRLAVDDLTRLEAAERAERKLERREG